MAEKKRLHPVVPQGRASMLSKARCRPYAAPKLTEYGSIQDLTKGGAGAGSDFPKTGTKAV